MRYIIGILLVLYSFSSQGSSGYIESLDKKIKNNQCSSVVNLVTKRMGYESRTIKKSLSPEKGQFLNAIFEKYSHCFFLQSPLPPSSAYTKVLQQMVSLKGFAQFDSLYKTLKAVFNNLRVLKNRNYFKGLANSIEALLQEKNMAHSGLVDVSFYSIAMVENLQYYKEGRIFLDKLKASQAKVAKQKMSYRYCRLYRSMGLFEKAKFHCKDALGVDTKKRELNFYALEYLRHLIEWGKHEQAEKFLKPLLGSFGPKNGKTYTLYSILKTHSQMASGELSEKNLLNAEIFKLIPRDISAKRWQALFKIKALLAFGLLKDFNKSLSLLKGISNQNLPVHAQLKNKMLIIAIMIKSQAFQPKAITSKIKELRRLTVEIKNTSLFHLAEGLHFFYLNQVQRAQEHIKKAEQLLGPQSMESLYFNKLINS